MQCLAKYLIQTADGPAYRSGNLDGMRHPGRGRENDPRGRWYEEASGRGR